MAVSSHCITHERWDANLNLLRPRSLRLIGSDYDSINLHPELSRTRCANCAQPHGRLSAPLARSFNDAHSNQLPMFRAGDLWAKSILICDLFRPRDCSMFTVSNETESTIGRSSARDLWRCLCEPCSLFVRRWLIAAVISRSNDSLVTWNCRNNWISSSAVKSLHKPTPKIGGDWFDFNADQSISERHREAFRNRPQLGHSVLVVAARCCRPCVRREIQTSAIGLRDPHAYIKSVSRTSITFSHIKLSML